MSSARVASLAGAIVASLIVAAPSRAVARSAKAPAELSLILLPHAPGADNLTLGSPASGDAPRRARPFTRVAAGAIALWATHPEWPAPGPRRLRPEAAAGFAIAGAGVLIVLAGTWLAKGDMPVDRVHTVLLIGPGGAGVGLAARF